MERKILQAERLLSDGDEGQAQVHRIRVFRDEESGALRAEEEQDQARPSTQAQEDGDCYDVETSWGACINGTWITFFVKETWCDGVLVGTRTREEEGGPCT